MPAITLSPEEVELALNTPGQPTLNNVFQRSDSQYSVPARSQGAGIAANSPAAEAGIEVKDIILQIDETRLDHPDSLQAPKNLPSASNQYLFQIRRDTLVYETTVMFSPLQRSPNRVNSTAPTHSPPWQATN